MSGGKFNYQNDILKDEIYGYSMEPTNVFGDWMVSELVWDMFNLLHAYDWYASGDTCEETWQKAKRQFKDKWFCDYKQIEARVIDAAVDKLRRELYETFIGGQEND